MDKYLRFRNKAGHVNRIALEKLGFSTKRNDPSTIGQFGSGIKFAPIAALRNGWDWVFTGEDASGVYEMRYTSAVEEGIDCIVYNYGAYQKSSSFTVDAGVLSWVDAFQIYREALANAVDASNHRSDWDVKIVTADQVKHEEGYFSCFITAAPELLNIHNQFDKYFCIDRTPTYSWTRSWDERKFRLYDTVDDLFRVYSHGVLVYSSDEVTSLFDYECNGIALNEERTLKNLWELESDIARIIASCDDITVQKMFLRTALNLNANDYYEFGKISSAYWGSMYFHNSWLETFTDKHGDNVVIYDKIGAAKGMYDYLLLRKKTPLYVESECAYEILKRIGVTSYDTFVDESDLFEADFLIDRYPQLLNAIKIASKFDSNINDVFNSGKIGVFEPNGTSSIGLTVNMNKSMEERVILVNREHVESGSPENLVATLIHEMDHLLSGRGDGNDAGRMFRDLADRRLGELMVKYYDEVPVTLDRGVLQFPMDKWTAQQNFQASFSIEPSITLSKLILKVSNMAFLVNSDARYDDTYIYDVKEGQLGIHESLTSFTIPNLTNVTEVRKIS